MRRLKIEDEVAVAVTKEKTTQANRKTFFDLFLFFYSFFFLFFSFGSDLIFFFFDFGVCEGGKGQKNKIWSLAKMKKSNWAC